MNRTLRRLLMIVTGLAGLAGCSPTPAGWSVVYSQDASLPETLAAREVRRYVYLRTGRLLPLIQADAVHAGGFDGVVIGRKDRTVVRALARDAGLEGSVAVLDAQHYLIKTIRRDDRRYVLIAGGDDAGALYGAYRFAEQLGVRFYLHGDVIPDDPMPLAWPVLDETASPLFELRGIQPFHDFPEGPDWWNVEDYKAIISQLPKLRMNFIGLHTYPEGGVGPEPTVWIGSADGMKDDGLVTFSYPARHFTTHSGTWGYKEKNTGDYGFGASALFEHDAYGADVMNGMTPWPPTPEACNELFNRFGSVLREAFLHARALGIKTCVGTETPLVLPKAVQERLRAEGKDPADAAVAQGLYEGMFRRIARSYPLDYYWLWTPEGWTWQGATDEQVAATLGDLRAAIAAARVMKPPFTLATCGWVLGPPQDRSLFDKELPKDMPISCINRQVGKSPVEPGFARVTGRGQWAIPWLEDDPNLVSPQLWVGRMRRDAFDALRYGCSGLMGIHWRTRVLGPNVSALAGAAWDQRGWSEAASKEVEQPCEEGTVGGNVAAYPNSVIADTDDDPLYQTVRYDMSAYRIKVPDGTYRVTLKFCEPHYGAANQRVFGVEIQGRRVLHKLDLFAKAGKDKALDYTFKDVVVHGGPLTIDFTQRVEYPCIAAIVVEGTGVSRRINCGGPAYKDYEADLPTCPSLPRHLPAGDFYADWAASQFGPDAGPKAAAIFEKLDGQFPEPSTWVNGPGGLQADPRSWDEAAKAYAFVDALAALRPLVQGAGRLERFDYWLSSFQYVKAVARLKCAWGAYDKAMAQVEAADKPDAKRQLARSTALPLREQLIKDLAEVYRHLLATVSTPGEMGTVANWEQHIGPMLLIEPGKKLAEILGEPLPADALPGNRYAGGTRVIVPTVRTTLTAGEALKLKVIVLADHSPSEVALLWRAMGAGAFTRLGLTHVARGVYSAELGPEAIGQADLEYYVEVAVEGNGPLRFPATAPGINQTVVVLPRPDA